jgi:hypothetical protein
MFRIAHDISIASKKMNFSKAKAGDLFFLCGEGYNETYFVLLVVQKGIVYHCYE